MPNQLQFARNTQFDSDRLQSFIDRGWLSPPIIDGRPVFRDVDVARAALIADLADDMGINEEGIDLVLDLLDQVYGLRSALGDLIDALQVQPRGVRVHLVNDARRLYTLTQRGSRGFR